MARPPGALRPQAPGWDAWSFPPAPPPPGPPLSWRRQEGPSPRSLLRAHGPATPPFPTSGCRAPREYISVVLTPPPPPPRVWWFVTAASGHSTGLGVLPKDTGGGSRSGGSRGEQSRSVLPSLTLKAPPLTLTATLRAGHRAARTPSWVGRLRRCITTPGELGHWVRSSAWPLPVGLAPGPQVAQEAQSQTPIAWFCGSKQVLPLCRPGSGEPRLSCWRMFAQEAARTRRMKA